MDKKKLVKVYVEDWDTLNGYLSIRQLQKGKRMSFADVLGEVVKEYVKPVVDAVKKGMKR